MSIKIEAETELQLVCNNVDQSLVEKETPECEVSKSDGNDETSVELGNDSSCNLAVNSQQIFILSVLPISCICLIDVPGTAR